MKLWLEFLGDMKWHFRKERTDADSKPVKSIVGDRSGVAKCDLMHI
jgi:hypothetical protein